MRKNPITIARMSLLIFVLILAGLSRASIPVIQDSQSVDGSNQRSVDEEIGQLLTVLQDEELRRSDPERVVQAIDRLGQMKAIEAVDDLVALLTVRRTFEWEKGRSGPLQVDLTDVSTGSRYPAIEALSEIGKPALSALVQVIETREYDSLESKNAVYTVIIIFRENLAEGVAYLRDVADHASSPEGGGRLFEAADMLEALIQ